MAPNWSKRAHHNSLRRYIERSDGCNLGLDILFRKIMPKYHVFELRVGFSTQISAMDMKFLDSTGKFSSNDHIATNLGTKEVYLMCPSAVWKQYLTR